MRQQRNPVLAGNDLEWRDQHPLVGVPFKVSLGRINRQRELRRIAVDNLSGAGDNLAAEIGWQTVTAEFALRFSLNGRFAL